MLYNKVFFPFFKTCSKASFFACIYGIIVVNLHIENEKLKDK